MVRTEDAVIARFEHSGERFEILVDADLAMDLKHGKEVSFEDYLSLLEEYWELFGPPPAKPQDPSKYRNLKL